MSNGKRRIAAIVLLVLFVAFGFIPTIATADDGARFVLPERQQGDVIDYHDEGGAHPVALGELIVEEPMAWKDEHGVWHRADLLTSVYASFNFGDFEFSGKLASLVDGETWEPLAASTTAGGTSVSSGNLIPVLNGQSQESSNHHWGFTPDTSFHPCGILNGLQGAAEWSNEIIVGGDCDNGGPATFQYDRSTTWKGSTAMVYANDAAPASFGGASGVELTFAPGIPYPVTIKIMLQESSLAAHLEGFHQGNAPLLYPASLSPATPLPVVTNAPASRYGPDLGTVDSPFPLEDALATAEADPSYSDVRDFMDANPDWRVNLGSFEDEGDRASWLIGLSTPVEGMAFTVYRTPNEPAGLNLQDTPLAWTYTYQTWSIIGGPAPSLEDMQNQVASGDSVANAWRTYAETADAPNAVSFYYGFCGGLGCSDFSFVQVGSIPVEPPQEDGTPLGLQDDPTEWDGESHQIAYGPEGVVRLEMFTSSYKNSGGLLATPQPEEVGESAEAGIALNTPAATAGIIMGLLAASTYYFWPALKTFPGFALFSRLQRPVLLDHPSRRAIMDAVEATPGIRYSELQRQTGLGQSTLRHHVGHLGQAGMLREKNLGGFTCFFAPQDATRENLALAGSAQSDGARTVLEFIQRNPGTTARSIASDTGLAVGTIGYHVKRLRDAGVISSERDGRTVRLAAA